MILAFFPLFSKVCPLRRCNTKDGDSNSQSDYAQTSERPSLALRLSCAVMPMVEFSEGVRGVFGKLVEEL